MAEATVKLDIDSGIFDQLIERAASGVRHGRTLGWLRELHQPRDVDGEKRCAHCIAGYDPGTGKLVHVMWPCTTASVIEGGEAG